MITEQQLLKIKKFQKDEITSHHLYAKLAGLIKDQNNAKIIREMSDTELRHYEFWKNVSKVDVKPESIKIFFLVVMTRLLGLTFSIKLIERSEAAGAKEYAEFESVVPGSAQLGKDEEEHEESMMAMIEEEFLSYVGSIVLGLNDALVELTGTLAGLTFALQSGQLVAVSGLITGIAAAFSMAASEFLSAREEKNSKAGRSALYTGAAYLATVLLLILPYLLVPQHGNGIFVSLVITLIIAILIILGFNFYVSVAKDIPFKQRFLEMLGISMGVSALSFIVGLIVRNIFGIDM
jgi:VIT1/CCC1 family predicted Fe2+/Mn2+ transporter